MNETSDGRVVNLGIHCERITKVSVTQTFKILFGKKSQQNDHQISLSNELQKKKRILVVFSIK